MKLGISFLFVVALGCSEPTLAEMRACTVDADCAAVLSVCCGCDAQLDDVMGLNRHYQVEYREFLGCGSDAACHICLSNAAYAERRASCSAGVCEGGAVRCVTSSDCAAGNGCVAEPAVSSSGLCLPMPR